MTESTMTPIEAALFEIQESIARGGPCLECAAEWQPTPGSVLDAQQLHHRSWCRYLEVLEVWDELERQDRGDAADWMAEQRAGNLHGRNVL